MASYILILPKNEDQSHSPENHTKKKIVELDGRTGKDRTLCFSLSLFLAKS